MMHAPEASSLFINNNQHVGIKRLDTRVDKYRLSDHGMGILKLGDCCVWEIECFEIVSSYLAFVFDFLAGILVVTAFDRDMLMTTSLSPGIMGMLLFVTCYLLF